MASSSSVQEQASNNDIVLYCIFPRERVITNRDINTIGETQKIRKNFALQGQLNFIRAKVETIMANSGLSIQESVYKIGPAPAGSSEGTSWCMKGQTKIKQILISFGDHIHSICFQYADENGIDVLSPKFGNSEFNGPGFKAIALDSPAEIITGISLQRNSSSFEKLSIHTNKCTYGPFGGNYYQILQNQSPVFEMNVGPRNEFFGFHGTHDYNRLSSIGIYLKIGTTLSTSVSVETRDHSGANKRAKRLHVGSSSGNHNNNENN